MQPMFWWGQRQKTSAKRQNGNTKSQKCMIKWRKNEILGQKRRSVLKNEQFFSSWKDTLIQEIQEYKISNLHTLYFGGGTPSVLSVDDFTSIRNCFPKDIDEFTVECNPESLDEEKLAYPFVQDFILSKKS